MPSDEVAADGNLSRTFSGAIAPFTDVPRDWGCGLWREGQRTSWVGFSWLRYSVLTSKFFTFTEGGTTAKLLLGVSQGAPSSKENDALSTSITFSHGKPCFEPTFKRKERRIHSLPVFSGSN